jgi:glycosyltransferase involved in cell wall biosynthesis
MRTYDKRIGFLINQDHLKSTGGNGQFARSFCRLMNEHNIKVDIITDKEPKRYANYAKSLNTNIIYPDNELSYADHGDTFGKPDNICSERLVNFRNAVMKAMSTNTYDILICNSPEAIQVGISLGLEDTIQIIAYTHLESQIFTDTSNPFLPVANKMMRQHLTCDGLYIATQSKFNKEQFAEHPNASRVFECPIPITEPDLLKRHDTERKGVLFVGRWEPGKNYELFLQIMEQNNRNSLNKNSTQH